MRLVLINKVKQQKQTHQMKIIFAKTFTLQPFNLLNKFSYNKIKTDVPLQATLTKHSLFKQKSFMEIINIIKNPDNPYPKNTAYYHAILEFILDESNQNNKIMLDHGQVIHVFLQDVMQRIKTMASNDLSDLLGLLRHRPKALRFQKELLITMHVRFQNRIKQLIQINEENKVENQGDRLTMQNLKLQIGGLFYLKKNTVILSKVLEFSFNSTVGISKKPTTQTQIQQLARQQKIFYEIIYIVNQNLEDTIDTVRQSIAEFISFNYQKGLLPYHREILRMIVKCKFYKNYPIVRNQDWIHQYVFNYLSKTFQEGSIADIQEMTNVLKHGVTYMMHIDPWSRQGFKNIVDKGYEICKKSLQSISSISNKDQVTLELNAMAVQIKLIPSYLYLKNILKINVVDHSQLNRVDEKYIKSVVNQIKPIIKKFILVSWDLKQVQEQSGNENGSLKLSIEESVKFIDDFVKKSQDPEKLLLKSVQNLLNTVTVFKDYNLVNIDIDFAILLAETEIIYCILCRHWIADQVRYLRLLQHAVFVLAELQRQLNNNNPAIVKYKPKIDIMRKNLQEELAIFDNVEKSYKQFTVLRLVAIFKSLGIQPKYLGDYYRNIKMKKPNIYVETLSRTMLKSYNFPQIIQSFELMSEGKIPVKEIQLGRIVFLSAKQPILLKYWIHQNRKYFVSKVCFCRRIMNNIVSIIRMDNLQINRNSIQILAEIVAQYKLFEIQNNSISNHLESNSLKRILCNNFSILFRYSKMDSMIEDIFIVNKNIPTVFRNKFSHIQVIKVLTFSAYLSEQQSIFYINRENKNALFKYVIMLMRQYPFAEKSKEHYLLGKGYNDQSIMLSVVDKIIEQYWPDNKLMNKGMPFYSQFLTYYTRINEFSKLVHNQNTTFLIIKQILQDYRQVQNNQPLKYFIARIENSYERLHILSIYDNEANLGNTLENVLSSMNHTMNIKIFSEFIGYIQNDIENEIKDYEKQIRQGKTAKYFVLPWKQNNLNKHLINLMAVRRVQNLNQYTECEILSLLTVDLMVHGMVDLVNLNMQTAIKRILKINPTSIRYDLNSQNRKRYPYELFKIVLSNLNIYLTSRARRLEIGKEKGVEEISNERIQEWIIKSLLNYSQQIFNNEEMQDITRYLNNWNIDILALMQAKFLSIKQNLQNSIHEYYDVEILSIFFSQNIIKYYEEKGASSLVGTQLANFSNQKFIEYISVLLKQFEQTHLVNNYGIYFQEDGEKILNIIKGLLLMILKSEKQASDSYKNAIACLKKLKEIFEEFNKIADRTFKYNKLKSGGKFSYLNNSDMGEKVDMHETPVQRKNKHSSIQQSLESASVNVKLFSKFSEMLEVISMVRFGKWSPKNLGSSHQDSIKKINKEISKRQKALLIHSQLTYFTQTEVLVEERSFKQFGLTLYVVKKTQSTKNKTVILYVVNENDSMLYEFATKKRKRLTGEQQVTLDYLECLVRVAQQKENTQDNDHLRQIEIRVVPYKLGKAELKKLLTSEQSR